MTNKELLAKIYSDGARLLEEIHSIDDTRVTTWEERLDFAIRNIFGENSEEYNTLIAFRPTIISSSTTDAELLEDLKGDIREKLALLEAWISVLEDTEQMSDSEKKYQIFVSSTYDDLKEERQAVLEAILDLGFIPAGMEWFPSSNLSQWEYITKMLATTDYVVLISAGMYGSIVPDENISWTEKEYDYAISRGIPVLSFLHKDPKCLPAKNYDIDHEAELEAFKAKLSSGKLRNEYSDPADLKSKVMSSLVKAVLDTPRAGWVRGSVDEQVIEDNKNAELQEIRDELNEIKNHDTEFYWREITE